MLKIVTGIFLVEIGKILTNVRHILNETLMSLLNTAHKTIMSILFEYLVKFDWKSKNLDNRVSYSVKQFTVYPKNDARFRKFHFMIWINFILNFKVQSHKNNHQKNSKTIINSYLIIKMSSASQCHIVDTINSILLKILTHSNHWLLNWFLLTSLERTNKSQWQQKFEFEIFFHVFKIVYFVI